MGMFAKKIELNILKIDQATAILSSKKVFQKNLNFRKKFHLARKNCYNLANFKDNPETFFWMITDGSLQQFIGQQWLHMS